MTKITPEQINQIARNTIIKLASVIQSTVTDEEKLKEEFRSLVSDVRVELHRLIEVGEYNLDEKAQLKLLKAQLDDLKKSIDELTAKPKVTTKKKVEVKTNPKWEERILVVNRDELFENETLTFQGVEQDVEKVKAIIDNLSANYEVMRRGSVEDKTEASNNAEVNKAFKQPIPYVLVKKGNEVFAYERLVQGGESRLHNKLSVAFGGHMNPVVELETFDDVLLENLRRELDEELHIESVKSELNYLGLINDDLDEVGEVHLGILATITLDDDAVVEVKEVDQLKGEWVSIEQLKSPEVYERLENWSKLTIDIM